MPYTWVQYEQAVSVTNRVETGVTLLWMKKPRFAKQYSENDGEGIPEGELHFERLWGLLPPAKKKGTDDDDDDVNRQILVESDEYIVAEDENAFEESTRYGTNAKKNPGCAEILANIKHHGPGSSKQQ